MKFIKNLLTGSLAVFGLFLASMAHAAIDVTAVVDGITNDGTTAAVAVGSAILGFLGVVLLYKLIRRIF